MTISFECEDCGRVLRVKDDYAGRKIHCPGCQSVLRVPNRDEEPAPNLTDEDEEEESPRRQRRSSNSKPGRRSSGAPSSDKVRRMILKLWPIELVAILLLVGLIHPKGAGMIAVLVGLVGICLPGFGLLGGMAAIAVSNPGHFATSLISPLHSRMYMSDADRKKLRTTFSPYMTVGGRGLLLTIIGFTSMIISFE